MDPVILLQRSKAQIDKKRYREAEAGLTRALQFGAYNSRIHNARGRLYTYYLKQYDKAILDLRRAILLAPKVARYWYNLANAQYRKIDCEFLAAASTYVRLCKSGSKCPANQLEWVENSFQHFSTTAECSMQ